MAFFRCPNCGKAVSDRAPHCPNCGFASKQEQGVIEKADEKQGLSGATTDTENQSFQDIGVTPLNFTMYMLFAISIFTVDLLFVDRLNFWKMAEALTLAGFGSGVILCTVKRILGARFLLWRTKKQVDKKKYFKLKSILAKSVSWYDDELTNPYGASLWESVMYILTLVTTSILGIKIYSTYKVESCGAITGIVITVMIIIAAFPPLVKKIANLKEALEETMAFLTEQTPEVVAEIEDVIKRYEYTKRKEEKMKISEDEVASLGGGGGLIDRYKKALV